MSGISIIHEYDGQTVGSITFETDDPLDISKRMDEFVASKLLIPGDVIRIVDLDKEGAL